MDGIVLYILANFIGEIVERILRNFTFLYYSKGCFLIKVIAKQCKGVNFVQYNYTRASIKHIKRQILHTTDVLSAMYHLDY
jgi:hypothetical protein